MMAFPFQKPPYAHTFHHHHEAEDFLIFLVSTPQLLQPVHYSVLCLKCWFSLEKFRFYSWCFQEGSRASQLTSLHVSVCQHCCLHNGWSSCRHCWARFELQKQHSPCSQHRPHFRHITTQLLAGVLQFWLWSMQQHHGTT